MCLLQGFGGCALLKCWPEMSATSLAYVGWAQLVYGEKNIQTQNPRSPLGFACRTNLRALCVPQAYESIIETCPLSPPPIICPTEMLHPVFSAAQQRSAPDGSLEREFTISGSDSSLFYDWVKVGWDHTPPTPALLPLALTQYTITAAALPPHNTQGCSDEAVVTYFKGVSSGLAKRQLQHYHFKISNGRFDTRTRTQTPRWHCTVFYGAQDAAAENSSTLHTGPLQVR